MFNVLMKKRRDQRKALAGAVAAQPTEKPAVVGDDDQEVTKKPINMATINKIGHWMKPYKRQYVFVVVLSFVIAILEMLGPLYLRHLVDYDIPGGHYYTAHFLARPIANFIGWFSTSAGESAYAAFTGEKQAVWNIVLTISLWAITVLVTLLLTRFSILYTTRTGETIVFNLRKAVFAHLQKLSMSFYDKTKFGRILTRGTSDLDAMRNTIVNGIGQLVALISKMLMATLILFIVDWRIACSVLWLAPILYWMNIVYRNKVGYQWRLVREHFTRVSTNLVENINGMKVVAAFNRQEENLEQFNVLQDRNTANNINAAQVNGFFQPMLQFVGFLGKITILFMACYLMFSTHGAAAPFTVGMLIACWFYWDRFMDPLIQFGNFYNETLMSMASGERVFALLEQKPEIIDAGDSKPLPPIKGQVTFENVNFAYDPKKQVLFDVSFSTKPGQTIALVGHTGCGKSTIMNLICRFYLPMSGRILIDGHDTKLITGESLHHQMGIVSQSNFLFSGTVLDNIRYAVPDATEEQVIAASKTLGSHDIISAMKDGYHTQVGERGSSMSLGQRQLICFTRAFLANPRILILDEATSAVDTHTELLIQRALEKLVAHRTTFIVAHRLSTVVNADLVIVLDHGRIIERGTHKELLAIPSGKYAELYKQFTREIAE